MRIFKLKTNYNMIISTLSLKGGSGKTTTAINLAVYFANKGKKIVIVDADVNENISRWNEIREQQNEGLNNIDFIVLNKVNDFKNDFDEITKNYDIVLIDGRPAVNDIAAYIISISNLAIMPIIPSPLDMWTTDEVYINVYEKALQINKDLKGYFLINRVKPFSNIYHETKAALKGYNQFININVFDSILNDRVVYAESISEGKGALETKNIQAKGEVIMLGDEVSKILNIEL